MKYAVELIKLLEKLEKLKIYYKLNKVRENTVMIEVAIPGERWEIELNSYGTDKCDIEIEKFKSDGIIHGEDEFKKAQNISNCLFSGNIKELTDEEIEDAFKDLPLNTLEDKPLIDLLVDNKIASSRREAREFISNNAITVNGEIVNDPMFVINNNRKYNIVRRGKKKYYVFKKID